MDFDTPTVRQRHDLYVAKAEEAEQQLASVKDQSMREAWKQLADRWRQLADQIVRALSN